MGKIDQYDGEASNIWHMYIGDHKQRTNSYRDWLSNILRSHKCERVLDAATGTGVDSEMLVEEGFQVTSIDNSTKMLEKARALRAKRKHQPRFDSWRTYQANWLRLEQDLRAEGELDKGLFDAVILLGNSFSHLPNEQLQKDAIQSFHKVLRPGGLLVIDHRNYDAAMNGERVSQKSSYYNGNSIEQVDTYMISKNGKHTLVVLDYFINMAVTQNGEKGKLHEKNGEKRTGNFKLYFYPIGLQQMKGILEENFKPTKSQVYGDFKLIDAESHADAEKKSSYFCHVVQK